MPEAAAAAGKAEALSAAGEKAETSSPSAASHCAMVPETAEAKKTRTVKVKMDLQHDYIRWVVDEWATKPLRHPPVLTDEILASARAPETRVSMVEAFAMVKAMHDGHARVLREITEQGYGYVAADVHSEDDFDPSAEVEEVDEVIW